MSINTKKQKGFTLIEILIVISLVAILSAITIIAINPAKHFQDSRNAQRSSNVSEILNAMSSYLSDKGHAVADFGAITTCPTATNIGTGVGLINLTTTLVDTYIVSIPTDPTNGTAADTKYNVCKTTSGRLTIAAPGAEGGVTISVSR
jgi:prepilin-type N-terminal cleavage/methylation domain-containing protein